MTNEAIREDYKNYRNKTIGKNLNRYSSSKRAFKELNRCQEWIQKLKDGHKEAKNRNEIINCATKFNRDI